MPYEYQQTSKRHLLILDGDYNYRYFNIKTNKCIMKTKDYCKQTKCPRKWDCKRYMEGIRNVFNKEPNKVPVRDVKKCKDYAPLLNN